MNDTNTANIFTNKQSNQSQPTDNNQKSLVKMPRKPINRTVAIVASGIAAVVVLTIILLWVFVWSSVSRQDYRHAYEAMQGMVDETEKKSDDIQYSLNDLLSGDSKLGASEIAKSRDEMKAVASNLSDRVKSLGQEKAIKSDGEAKSRYNKVVEQQHDYQEALSTLASIYGDNADALAAIAQLSDVDYTSVHDDAQSYVNKLRNIAKQLDDVDSDNDDVEEAFQSASDGYEQLAQAFEAYQKDDYSGYSDHMKQAEDKIDDFEEQMTDVANDMSESEDEFEQAVSNLGNYLLSKSYGNDGGNY